MPVEMRGLYSRNEKKWKHTRRLKVKDRGPHEPEPYARIGEDNRCSTCGDIIVEVKE